MNILAFIFVTLVGVHIDHYLKSCFIFQCSVRNFMLTQKNVQEYHRMIYIFNLQTHVLKNNRYLISSFDILELLSI